VHTVKTPVKDENDNVIGILGIFWDITESRRLQEQLREGAKKYREIINAMNDMVFVVGFDGKFVDVNDATVKFLGYSRDELQSMGPQDIDGALTVEEIGDIVNGMKTAEAKVFETVQITKDGKKIPVEISCSRLIYHGKPTVLSIARDITDRKKAEDALDTMMNELEKVIEKLRVVGEGTRHDARNKLSIVLNNAYLIKQCLTGDNKTLEYLGAIESTVEQIEKIFDFAKTYEMIGVEERSYVNVEKSVEKAVKLYSGLGGTKLENECRGLTVLADLQLMQLFYNLVDNSMKHGEKVTKIRVYYEEKQDVLKLIYEDDGVGIPEDKKEKIFKEGYGKSTGYGLCLIKKICEAYGWTIRETGKHGKGAQFTMTLPKTNKNGKQNYQLK
jgi:PAS domain S-box-containing protein